MPRHLRTAIAVVTLAAWCGAPLAEAEEIARPRAHDAAFVDRVKPLLAKYCASCHSEEKPEGDLNLERFASAADVRKSVKQWQSLLERVKSGEMPPEDSPQPTPDERRTLVDWTRDFLDDEATARAGDPGRRPLRRLSNAEYNYTIRDLTGVDLQPAREFPADGAAGEGFTNAAEALAMSPALMAKYLNAAKSVAGHAVLLPDGFRFSPSKTQRDWVDESVARLRAFYARIANGGRMPETPTVDQQRAGYEPVTGSFSGDGRLPLQPYLAALVAHRDELSSRKISLQDVGAQEKLSSKYLTELWNTLHAEDDSFLLQPLRARFKRVSAADVNELVAAIEAQNVSLWEMVKIGSYRRGDGPRALAKDPPLSSSQTFRLQRTSEDAAREATIYLRANSVVKGDSPAVIVWQRPRFEATNQPPLLLSDYPNYGPRYESDLSAIFASTGPYLTAVMTVAHNSDLTTAEAAKRHGLDLEWLQRWQDVSSIVPIARGEPRTVVGRTVPPLKLTLLDEKTPANAEHPTVSGWRPKGAELPVVVGNSSDETRQIPGRIGAHRVAVHPMPAEFVAVAWRSPIEGRIRVQAKIAHAHSACGNGVAWRIESQTPGRSAVLSAGVLELGRQGESPSQDISVSKNDEIILAVDARDSNHVCDLTEISLTLTELTGDKRVWDLAADAADRLGESNPLSDKFGNSEVWRFARGPSSDRPVGEAAHAAASSLFARWRDAAADSARKDEAIELVDQIQAVLTGPRPAEKDPNRGMYDEFVAVDGPLLRNLDLTKLTKSPIQKAKLGLDAAKFGKSPNDEPIDSASLSTHADETLTIRVPAELLRGRTFVVEGRLSGRSDDCVVQLRVGFSDDAKIDFGAPLLALEKSGACARLQSSLQEFRRVFPPFICYPYVLPIDEVVCLKTFHREDEPLIRLFLDEEQTRRIDHLWAQHRFISRFPVVENDYLPLFIGFVTQDQPKELVTYYEGFREPFQRRAEKFERDFAAAAARQMQTLVEFAGRAYRRPLTADEVNDLNGLYAALRESGISHEQAFRDVLTRVLVAPKFLLHLESAPAGDQPGPVDDWALASRLSYFLWSSLPDEELRTVAAAGRLHDPETLTAQAMRMLRDPRSRALAVEFGTQWIHVRGFDEIKEKNQSLFPTFDQNLKSAIYEESILFFQDLFQSDRTVREILDADYTFLNETLAQHYGVPNVAGPHWREVENVKRFGRGGILGLASVQAKQSGASRTSPVLRGNWVVETLLGEKLPPPPANVPQLPDAETGNDGLTTRQLVEKHVRQAECAGCHQRIDPLGFAMENYDPIGRRRETDLSGAPLDAKARLKDGTEFQGLDGLRNYLLEKKRDVVERLFCQRLLGYALGRSVTLSDTALMNEIVAGLKANDGRISHVIKSIVVSPQFRLIRGEDFVEEN